MKKILLLIISATILLGSCKKDHKAEPEPAKIKIAEKTTPGGLRIALWADKSEFTVAYNKVYVSLTKADGSEVNDASLTYHPLMNMISMQHSSPAEQPVYISTEHLYRGAVVFSMPSGEMGSWQLIVNVNNEPVVFDVAVAPLPSGTKYTGTFVGTDGNSYTVSLVEPLLPKIGINDIDVLVNRRVDMMNFPADEGFTIELNPEMPSMGHGSPNNVNPVHKSNGHYKGKVNFTMTGDWRLHLKLKKGGTVVVEDAALDLFF